MISRSRKTKEGSEEKWLKISGWEVKQVGAIFSEFEYLCLSEHVMGGIIGDEGLETSRLPLELRN